MDRRSAGWLLDHIEYAFECHQRTQGKHSDFLVTPDLLELVKQHTQALRDAVEVAPTPKHNASE